MKHIDMTVEDCEECPFRHLIPGWHMGEADWECVWKDGMVDRGEGRDFAFDDGPDFPDWCPLPEAELIDHDKPQKARYKDNVQPEKACGTCRFYTLEPFAIDGPCEHQPLPSGLCAPDAARSNGWCDYWQKWEAK